MKTLVKTNSKDIKNLNLPSIEILEVTESSGGDIRSISLRDRQSGEELHLRCGQYHEATVYTLKPKEFEEKFRLSGKLDGVVVSSVFDTEDKAKDYAERNNLEAGFTIVKVQVEKE